MRLLGSFEFDSFFLSMAVYVYKQRKCNQCRMENFIASVNEFSLFTLDFLEFVVIMI